MERAKRGIYLRTIGRARNYIESLWSNPNREPMVHISKNYRSVLKNFALTHKKGYVPDNIIIELLTPIYERDRQWYITHSGPDYTPTPRAPKSPAPDVAVQMTDKRSELLDFDTQHVPEIFGDEVTFKFNGFLFNIQKLK